MDVIVASKVLFSSMNAQRGTGAARVVPAAACGAQNLSLVGGRALDDGEDMLSCAFSAPGGLNIETFQIKRARIVSLGI